MNRSPKVFIVVLNYNGKETIKKCLTSVFKNTYPNFEVVVVDNDSRDGSLELAKSNFSKAHFIKNEKNLGFSAGNNAGIRFALERMAEFVLLLNNDTEVEADFLEKIIPIASEKEELGILSPVIFDGNTKKIWFSGGEINWFSMKTFHEREARTEDFYSTDFISGCAMLIRAEVFKKIGLLDENFFLYWEDVDFSVRAKKAGFSNAVVPLSWVYHFENSEKNKKNKTYWLVFSGLLFFKKHCPGWLRPWIVFYVFLRRMKNRLDLIGKKNETAAVVRKAHKDFQDAKEYFHNHS